MSRSLGWSVVAALALVALAVFATAWTTRNTVVEAAAEVRTGEAQALEQAVRGELNLFEDTLPTSEDLQDIVKEHSADGLHYVAVGPREAPFVWAGAHVAGDALHGFNLYSPQDEQHHRRRHGGGARGWHVEIELEPLRAKAMRAAASRTVGIGALAALGLLGVAAALMRRELRRRADESKQERDKRLASLGEMSAVLAHEIKNPLASLKGNAQLLVAMLPEGEKPRAKAQRVVDEALRLEQLTVDLLTFVRTGAIARVPGDPGALVREAATSVSPDIAVDAGAAPPQWSLDSARVRQVLVNLLDNAVAAGAPVRATVRAEAGMLVIEIADHGAGVPAADRDKIFEPFHTGKTHGTGLGLAVARRVVEQHGGTLTVGDAPGGGALFRVAIPA